MKDLAPLVIVVGGLLILAAALRSQIVLLICALALVALVLYRMGARNHRT